MEVTMASATDTAQKARCLATHTLFLFSLLGESCGSHENSDQNQKHGYIACCSELVGIIHHCYEK